MAAFPPSTDCQIKPGQGRLRVDAVEKGLVIVVEL
jgi:hypothetical protein